MIVLVCGSRNWMDAGIVRDRLSELPREELVILHGSARGADNIAHWWAVDHRVQVRPFPAQWETHGKRAGFIRNIEMLDEDPDLVIAFWDGTSRGTLHTINSAQARGIPVEVIHA